MTELGTGRGAPNSNGLSPAVCQEGQFPPQRKDDDPDPYWLSGGVGGLPAGMLSPTPPSVTVSSGRVVSDVQRWENAYSKVFSGIFFILFPTPDLC